MRRLDDQEIHIPIGLHRDILARLAVKSLLRFRCVCKLWCCLIDSEDFSLNTNNRTSTDVLVMRSVKGRDELIFTVRSTDTSKITDHLCTIYESYGTCNGLMLMSTQLSDSRVMLRLWNPWIRKSLILPFYPLSSEGRYRMRYVLENPSSADNNNCKVAAIRMNHSCGGGMWDVLIAVYSFQNHSWSSEIKRKNNFPWMPPLCGRVFSRGVWYWIHSTRLVSFDFDSEDFSVAELPDFTNQGVQVYGFIFALGESIALFSLSSVCSCIWLWIRMIIEKSRPSSWRPWLSRYSNCGKFSTLRSWMNGRCSKIFYNQGTDIFIINHCQKLLSYKFSTHRNKTLRCLVRDNITLANYVESLVLHKRTQGQTLTSFP